MNRTRRQEFFWLFVISACIVLFVMHRENDQTRSSAYGQSDTNAAALANTDHEPTGAILTPMQRPAAQTVAGPGGSRYYVPLGSYESVDLATKRYLQVVNRVPGLEKDRKIAIQTIKVSDGARHRVKMGDFASVATARSACAKARIPATDCPVVEVH